MTRSVKYFVLAVLFMLMLTPAAAGDAKIGIVDIQKIMRESKAAKDAQALFLKEVEAKRAILIAREKDVRKMEEEVRSLSAKTSAAVRQEKTDRLAKEVRELKRLGSDLDEELKKRDAELAQKLLAEIRQVLKSYSKKEDYTIILEKNTALVSDDAVDITDRIIRLYDAQKR
jgi:outer membrane protein